MKDEPPALHSIPSALANAVIAASTPLNQSILSWIYCSAEKRNKYYHKYFIIWHHLYWRRPLPAIDSSIRNIFEAINNSYKLIPRRITMEVNPEMSLWIFANLRSLGINRWNRYTVFDDNILKLLGRRHNAAEAVSAIHDSRKAFLQYRIDLIYGVHGQKISYGRRHTKGSILRAGTYFLLSAFSETGTTA